MRHFNQSLFLVFILLSVYSSTARSSNLEYRLTPDLPAQVQQNITVHLGTLPTTERQREAFVYAAKADTVSALQALGYYRAKVNLTIDKSSNPALWQLTINVALHQVTQLKQVNIVIKGDAQQDPAFNKLLENSPLKTGKPLNQGAYETFKADLLSLGQTRGYLDGHLLKSTIGIHPSYREADITIEYQSGHRFQFGQVNFNEQFVKKSVLNELIPFQQGDYYNTDTLINFQHQIQLTNYFSQIMVVPDKTKASQYIIPINVSLKNKQKHHFDIGVGFATDTKFRLSASWRTPLVNRFGHSQETQIKYSKTNPTGKFIYTIPLTHPLDDLLQFQVMRENAQYAQQNSRFFSVKIGRVRNEHGWVRQHYIRFLQEKWSISSTLDNSFNYQAKYYIPGFTWALSKHSGSIIDPTGGVSQWYNIEGASSSMGSALSFFRVNARWKYITMLGVKQRFVAKAELGALFSDHADDTNVTPSLRFYAGGDQSIRGFAYQSIGGERQFTSTNGNIEQVVIGGTRLVTLSFEYQYYLRDKVRLALFTDMGDATFAGRFKLKHSIGTGIHYISPVGAIRFNFGYGFGDVQGGWRLHFSVGAEL